MQTVPNLKANLNSADVLAAAEASLSIYARLAAEAKAEFEIAAMLFRQRDESFKKGIQLHEESGRALANAQALMA